MTILVTGGAGYVGSHVCVELLQAGNDVVIIDNLSNSSADVLSRVERIAGRSVNFVEGDINDPELLAGIFRQHAVTAVTHFAGLKAVGESVTQPLRYYYNNVCGTQCLLQAMDDADVRSLVFSSSATVYGEAASNPVTETFPLQATNPYGRSKLHIEQMLRDLALSDERWNIGILRYFNPVGAHESGLIGEDPSDTPNNLMPYVAQVAAGTLEQLQVFGDDYPTADGTGVRDYIHVVDLALGHLSALEKLATNPGCVAYNLGTGQGYSVLELVAAFSKASGKDIPYRIVARRAGDIATCFANPVKAREELGWQAVRGLEQMCVDAWRWQSRG